MRLNKWINTVDSHTAGMPTRMVVGGIPYIPGETIPEKRQYVIDHMAEIVGMLIDEPRGHRAMRGAIIIPPTTKEADLGVIFIGGGCMPMCGHSTIGIVTTVLEIGMITPVEPETEVVLETPAGLVRTKALVENGKVISVSMINVPAFVYDKDVSISIPGVGSLKVDIAFGGMFNVIVNSEDIGIEIRPQNAKAFIEVAAVIKETINNTIRVVHPEKAFINHVSHVQFYGPPVNPKANMKNIVISPPGLVDRSPCGTGTCARVALLYSRGQLGLMEAFIHESAIGTLFEGRALEETNVANFRAIIPQITGSAFLTGFHQFVSDPYDPINAGFSLSEGV